MEEQVSVVNSLEETLEHCSEIEEIIKNLGTITPGIECTVEGMIKGIDCISISSGSLEQSREVEMDIACTPSEIGAKL